MLEAILHRNCAGGAREFSFPPSLVTMPRNAIKSPARRRRRPALGLPLVGITGDGAMRRFRSGAVSVALVGAVLGAAQTQAQTQIWPTKPVRIVAPFAPGGAADTLGRIIAEPLGTALRQQFFVENRGGAGGLIGAASVATAAPDGYTFLVAGVASPVIPPSVSPNP